MLSLWVERSVDLTARAWTTATLLGLSTSKCSVALRWYLSRTVSIAATCTLIGTRCLLVTITVLMSCLLVVWIRLAIAYNVQVLHAISTLTDL